MKIYFGGPIRGGRSDRELYSQLIEYLGWYGEVLTEHVGDPELSELGEDGSEDGYIYHRDIGWLREADVLVAEVTIPSLGVGYEIGMAEFMGKKILCLYRPKAGHALSAMISGNPNIKVEEYSELKEVQKHIDHFMGENGKS